MVYNGCMASQYYLLSLRENSLERSEFAPKSVMINRGCSSAVLACTCLERESLLLPAMMSLVACCPLSDEIGQCGEVSLLHHFVLASENGCATERAACSTFCSKRQVFINMNNLSIRFYHRNLSSPARNRSTTWK